MKTSKKILSLFVIMCMALTMLAGTFTVSAAETVVYSITSEETLYTNGTATRIYNDADFRFGSNTESQNFVVTAENTDLSAYPGVEVNDMKITDMKTGVLGSQLKTNSNLQLSSTNPIGRMRYVVYYPSAIKTLATDMSLSVQYSNGTAKSANIVVGADGNVTYNDSGSSSETSNTTEMKYGQYVTLDWVFDLTDMYAGTATAPSIKAYLDGTLVGESNPANFTLEYTTSNFVFANIQLPKTENTEAAATHFVKEFSWTVMDEYTAPSVGGGEEPEPDPEPTTYEVKFMADGTQVGETQNIEENGFATPATAPAKDGYTFSHWATTEGGAEVDVTTYAITAATTFYAVYTENEPEGGDDTDYFYVPAGHTPNSELDPIVVASVVPGSATLNANGYFAYDGVRLTTNEAGRASWATAEDASTYKGVTAGENTGDFKFNYARSFLNYMPAAGFLNKTYTVAKTTYTVYIPSAMKGEAVDYYMVEGRWDSTASAWADTSSIKLEVAADGTVNGTSEAIRFDGWNTMDFVVDFSNWDGETVTTSTRQVYLNGVLIEETSGLSYDSVEQFGFENHGRFIASAIDGKVTFSKGATITKYAPNGYFPELTVTRVVRRDNNSDATNNDLVFYHINTTGAPITGVVLAVLKDANGFVTASYSASVTFSSTTDAGGSCRAKLAIPESVVADDDYLTSLTFYTLTDLGTFAPLVVSSAEL